MSTTKESSTSLRTYLYQLFLKDLFDNVMSTKLSGRNYLPSTSITNKDNNESLFFATLKGISTNNDTTELDNNRNEDDGHQKAMQGGEKILNMQVSITAAEDNPSSKSLRRHARSVDDTNSKRDDSQNKAQISLVLNDLAMTQSGITQCDKKPFISYPHFPSNPETNYLTFAAEVNLTVQVSNLLNSLYLHGDSGAKIDSSVLFALTQSVVQFSTKIKACGIAFGPSSGGGGGGGGGGGDTSSGFYPYTFRNKNGSIITTELSSVYNFDNMSWFSRYKGGPGSSVFRTSEMFYTDGEHFGDPSQYVKKANRTIRVSHKDGYWTTPYYDCEMQASVMQFSLPFYGLQKGVPQFK